MTIFINNKIYLSLFLFTVIVCFKGLAQETTVKLRGKINTDSQNLSKIHVVNINLEKGSVTDEGGNFEIIAALNDSLYFSSVEYNNRTIVVTKEMIAEGTIEVKLTTAMNELTEVVVDDIELSGYLANDIAKISVKNLERKFNLQMGLAEAIKYDREQHLYGNPKGGIRLDKIAGTVIKKLSKEQETNPEYSPKQIVNKSIQIVGHEFFSSELGLAENEIFNFVYYCIEDARRFKNLVLNSNAFVLIEYFQERIDDFRQRRGELLNSNTQIPG